MHRSEEEEEGGHHKPSHGHRAPALSCQASVLPLVQVHCSSSSGHSFICSVDGCMESFHLVFRCSVEVSRCFQVFSAYVQCDMAQAQE